MGTNHRTYCGFTKEVALVKALSFVVGLLMVIPPVFASDFAKDKIINKVRKHSVGVIAHYYLTSDVYVKELKKIRDKGLKYPDIIITNPEKRISYVGAGTILPDDHVVTVNHLFSRIDDVLGMKILIQGDGWEVPIRAIIVYRSKNEDFSDDYTILRMAHSPGLPGIVVANKGFKIGDRYMAIGSSSGFAYVIRFGFIIPIQKFFRRNELNELKISKWEDFPYTTIYPGAQGDSGGGVFNKKGELVTVMYCGIPNPNVPYVFANPNILLQDFLIEHGFGEFIKGYKDDRKRTFADIQQLYRK